MKEKNFRIVELEEHQVLLTKDFDNKGEEDKPQIIISFFHDGMKLDIETSYKSESGRDKLFEGISSEDVQGFIDMLLGKLD